MADFRQRPKGKYIQDADWAVHYELTQHWKSELLFYGDELLFFRRLIDNYFIWMTLGENLDAVRELEMDMLEVEKKSKDVLLKVSKHLVQLAESVEDPENKPTRVFRMEHESLEDDISLFTQKFRFIRKDVMAVTEQVLQSEQWADVKHHKIKSNVA